MIHRITPENQHGLQPAFWPWKPAFMYDVYFIISLFTLVRIHILNAMWIHIHEIFSAQYICKYDNNLYYCKPLSQQLSNSNFNLPIITIMCNFYVYIISEFIISIILQCHSHRNSTSPIAVLFPFFMQMKMWIIAFFVGFPHVL